jgi:hypothetical protein
MTVGDAPEQVQTYELPASRSPTTGLPFWTGSAGRFTYRDRRGENGAVKKLTVGTTRGTFTMEVQIDGHNGPVSLVAPLNEPVSTAACALLTINGGDTYSVKFMDGTMRFAASVTLEVSHPTRTGLCAITDATTTTTTTTTIDPLSTNTTTSTRPDLRPAVWLFGDSITALYCPVLQQEQPEWNVVCLGVPGETTTQGLLRLQNELETFQPGPAVVVVEQGTADCLAADTEYYGSAGGAIVCDPSTPDAPADVIGRLETMAELVRSSGAVSFVATTLYTCPVAFVSSCMAIPIDDPGSCPQFGCFVEEACSVGALVRAGSDPWIDFSLPWTELPDYVHPSVLGRELLAGRVATAIAAALSTSTTTTSSTTDTTTTTS